jgi:hypothetical protein
MNNAIKLDVFHGRADQDPQQFLDNIEVVCQVNQITDDNAKIKTVKSWLRGKAYHWYLAHGSSYHTWHSFTQAFLKRYGMVQETVLGDLSHCIQMPGESVLEFADRFLSLHSHLSNPIPDDLLRIMFLNGLSEKLREKVKLVAPVGQTMEDAMAMAEHYERTFPSQVDSGPDLENLGRPPSKQTVGLDLDQFPYRPAPPKVLQNPWRGNGNGHRPLGGGPPPKQVHFDRRPPEPRQSGGNRPGASGPPVPSKPPNTGATPQDVATLCKEMEQLKIQLAQMQKGVDRSVNFTQLLEQPSGNMQKALIVDGEVYVLDEAQGVYSKRQAEFPPEGEPPVQRRRPPGIAETTVDPNRPREGAHPAGPSRTFPAAPAPPVPPTPARPEAANRPTEPAGGQRPAQPVPRAAARAGGPAAVRRMVTAAGLEPLEQLKGLPMRLSVQTYLNSISELEYNRTIAALQEGRAQYLRERTGGRPPAAFQLQFGRQAARPSRGQDVSPTFVNMSAKSSVSTSAVCAPVVINGVLFDNGVIDTGASNTFISQNVARKLDLWDEIAPSDVKFTVADGQNTRPWGVLKNIHIGVEGLSFPLDAFVSAATSYDVLIGTDWLSRAGAEISMPKQEMTFRVSPNVMGRIPINVFPRTGGACYVVPLDQVEPENEDGELVPGIVDLPVWELGQDDLPVPPEEVVMDLGGLEIEEFTDDNISIIDNESFDEDPLTFEELEEFAFHFGWESSEGEEELLIDSRTADNVEDIGEIQALATLQAAQDDAIPREDGQELSEEGMIEDWMLDRHVFQFIESKWGPFEVDACADPQGLNAQLPFYWSIEDSCLGHDWAGKSIYCNPPFNEIQPILEHAIVCFRKDPLATVVLFILPEWRNAEWYTLVEEHMQVVHRYATGTLLFTAPPLGSGLERRRVGPTRWPVVVCRLSMMGAVGAEPSAQKLHPINLPKGDGDGGPLAIEMGNHLDEEQRTMLEELVERHRPTFTSGALQSRTTMVAHHINTGDALPVKARPYRLAKLEHKVIEEEVNKMLAAGVIQPSTSSWSSAPVLVPKPDGSVRFCIDYRGLNAVTTRDNYPMPRIDHTLESLGTTTKYMSKLDFKSAFWLIPMAEEDRPKTAFITPLGLYEFLSMPFGLKNAPATLQRFVDLLIGDLAFCVIYLDDCLIFSETFAEHLAHLEQVLQRFASVGFIANPSKCVLAADEMLYLGHILTPIGIKPNPIKIAAVREALPPTNITELKSFLGLVSYYRRFLPSLAEVALPLTTLTSKKVKFVWTESQQLAFSAVKKLLTEAPLLRFPDYEKEFFLYTDWQPAAIAAILGQKEGDTEYVVAYASKCLSGPELNYSPTDGELMAVVWAVKLFRPYLWGTPFTIITDHKALQWLQTTRNLTGKLARYAITLQEYDFQVQHRSGAQHGNVDSLSRLKHMPAMTGEVPLVCMVSSAPVSSSEDGSEDASEDGSTTSEEGIPVPPTQLVGGEWGQEVSDYLRSSVSPTSAEESPWEEEGSSEDEAFPYGIDDFTVEVPGYGSFDGAKLKEIFHSRLPEERTDLPGLSTQEKKARVKARRARQYHSLPPEWERPLGPPGFAYDLYKKTEQLREAWKKSWRSIEYEPVWKSLSQGDWGPYEFANMASEPPVPLACQHMPHINRKKSPPFKELETIAPYLDQSPSSDIVCQGCGGRDGEETMLICEACDHGFHLDCLLEPLSKVPEGVWVCDRCAANPQPCQEFREWTVQEETVDIARDNEVLQFLAEGVTDARGPASRRIKRRANNYYFDTSTFPVDWTDQENLVLRKRADVKHGPRIVPWPKDRRAIINKIHGELGHFGVNRTFAHISQRFFWAGMYEDVRHCLASCHQCQLRNTQITEHPDLQSIPVPKAWEMVGLDTVGPLKYSSLSGHSYIFTAIDYFTKWPEAKPSAENNAGTAAEFFTQDILARHGCPRAVVVDNGKEWRGSFEVLMKDLGVEIRRARPFHPQTNGLVERFNGTLKRALARMAGSNPSDWVRHLPLVLLGYRSAPQSSTRFSPFRLLYGREGALPGEQLQKVTQALHDSQPRGTTPEEVPPPTMEQIAGGEHQQQEEHTAALENIQAAQERQAKNYNQRRRGRKRKAPTHSYEPGSLVSITNYRKRGPMDAAYLGPYVFIGLKETADGTQATHAILEDQQNRRWQEPLLRIKPYQGPQPG